MRGVTVRLTCPRSVISRGTPWRCLEHCQGDDRVKHARLAVWFTSVSDPFAQPSSPPPARPPAARGQWSATPQPVRPTNGFAIASLTFGIIGGILFGVIFGIIALVQIRRRGQKGRGLAIAGLVLSGLWAIILGVGAALVIMDEADRDPSGEITREGSVPATSMQVGDCLENLEEASAISSLPAVPCSEPHEGEVFGLFDLPTGDYPDQASMESQASTRCSELLRAYSAAAFDDPSVGLFYLYPLESGWPDDREVVCIAAALDGPVTGSYADR